jgi:ABC-type transport system involved in cytochrome bd biosynthesis fused ATPase/permease subunit
LTGHVAALRLDAALKEHLFAVAVAPGDGIENEQTGTLLHAVTSDAEVAENSLLRVLSPVVTYVGVILGGCAVLAKVNLLVSALVALGGVALALIVVAEVSLLRMPQHARPWSMPSTD